MADSADHAPQQSLAIAPIQGRALTSSSPDLIRLGTLAPSLADIEHLVSARRTQITDLARLKPSSARWAFLEDHDVLPFREYGQAVANAAKWRRELRQNAQATPKLSRDEETGLEDLAGDLKWSHEKFHEMRQGALRHKAALASVMLKDTELTPALRSFLFTRYREEKHTPDQRGWMQYLADVTPAFADQIEALATRAELPEDVRRQHTLITAASGQGKSELLKTLIHHYVANDSAAVVFIDPHGDVARQVARWPDFRGTDRLVYIEPGLKPGRTVGLNPLDARGLDAEGVAVCADQLATALGELSRDLTGNMELIALGTVRMLLEDGNATFFDLVDLLENPPKQGEETESTKNRRRLIAAGRRHPHRAMRQFFEGRLEADSLKSAREGINNRLFRLLLRPSFEAMTCGRPTIHLQTLLDQRKVVVINTAPLGPAGASVMGRLVVALVAAIGRRREGTPLESRVPCHLFVDEAQTMATPAMGQILFELRKFGIHLTLAQQVEGVGFDDAGQKALSNSTAIKFVGSEEKAVLRPVFKDKDPPELPPLKVGQFWMRWGRDGAPTLIQVQSGFAPPPGQPNPTHRITDEEWAAEIERQDRRWYRDDWEDEAAPRPNGDPANQAAAERVRRPRI